MLPLKLVRSLVLGETLNNNPFLLSHSDHHHSDEENALTHVHQNPPSATMTESRKSTSRIKTNKRSPKTKIPLLFFLPTRELVADTYRLATIARDMGMDLYPTPSLSHIIFSYPSSISSSSSASVSPSSLSYPSSCSSLSLSSSLSWSLPNDAVMLTFPSLSASSLSHLRSFVSLSKGLFKLVFITTDKTSKEAELESSGSNWNCCSISLFSRLTGDRIDSMEAFSRALAGVGWTLFKTKKNVSPDSVNSAFRGGNSFYLFRKVDSGRVRARRGNGECRIRELRLPELDFRNAPLRILQYVVLMTDDVFFLA